MKPKTSLLDRALNDLGNIGAGFLPGIAELGQGITNDAYAAAPFTPNKFKLPTIGRSMAKGIWAESALPPLLLGDPGEALSRASARPVSALLDLSLAAPASTGLARLGSRFEATRAPSMDFLGFQKTAPEFALGAQMDDSIFARPADLPGRVLMDDGSIKPMREFGLEPESIRSFGDGDLWLRPTKRTMSLGQRPETMLEQMFDEDGQPLHNGAEAESLMGQYDANRLPAEGTALAQDPWRMFTDYRAKSEPLARVGDFMHSIKGDIPANRLMDPQSRIGKKIYRNVESARLIEIDDARASHEKALANAINWLRSNEETSHLTDEQIREALGNETVRRALGVDEESFQSARSSFDPTEVLKLNWDELKGRTVREVRDDFGIQLDRKNPHDESVKLPDDDDIFDEWLNKPEVAHALDTDRDGNYEMRALSARHRQARQDWQNERAIAEMSIRKHLADTNSFSVPVLRHRDGEEIVVDETNVDEHLDKILGHEDGWNTFFENDSTRRFDDALAGRDAEINDQKVHYQRALDTQLRNVVASYKAARKRNRNFDDHSKFLINQQRARRDGILEAVPGFEGPGVLGALDRISSNNLAGIDAPEVQAYFDELNRIRAASAENVKGWMGEELFSDEVRERSSMRGNEWLTGNPGESGEFFPMMNEIQPARGQIKGKKEKDSIQEFETDRTPGDPFELFLRGKFRTDYKVILDDFEKNLNYKAGADLFRNVKNLAMRITPEQYEKHRNKEISEADAMTDKYGQGTFVRLKRDGILAKETHRLYEGLVRMAAMKSHMGDDAGADALHSAAQFVKHADLTDPHSVPLEQTMQDPGVRQALVKDRKSHEDILIIPSPIYQALRSELLKGQQAMGGTFRFMTDLWKQSVLHMRFLQWMKNNVIGAHIMVGMAGGPVRYAETVGKFMDGTYDKQMREVVRSNMNDVMASGSSMQARESGLVDPDDPSALKRAYGTWQRKFINPLSEVNAKYADDPTRMIRIFQLMEDQLEAVSKINNTKPADLTIEQVEAFMNDEVMRSELARRTNTDMVDFSDMSEDEKRWVRSVFPFWAWMKGSAKASMRLAADHPGHVWAAGEIADLGEMALAEDQGTHIPDFAKAWWDPGEAGGNVIDTSGMNPYGSMFDFGAMGLGLLPDLIPGDRSTSASYRQFGSENMLSTMHPILGGGIEAATGRNVFFGTPIPNASIGSTFLNNQADLPILNLARKFYENETGPDATTRYDRGMALTNYMGIPIKDARWGQVNRRGWDEISERYRNGLAARELAPRYVP